MGYTTRQSRHSAGKLMIAPEVPAPGVIVPEEDTRRTLRGFVSFALSAGSAPGVLGAPTLPTGAFAARCNAAGRSIGFSNAAADFFTTLWEGASFFVSEGVSLFCAVEAESLPDFALWPDFALCPDFLLPPDRPDFLPESLPESPLELLPFFDFLDFLDPPDS